MIAIVCFALFVVVVPLLATVLGLPLEGALFQLLKICAAVVALGYIVFGTYP
jgi:hypothetical protein